MIWWIAYAIGGLFAWLFVRCVGETAAHFNRKETDRGAARHPDR